MLLSPESPYINAITAQVMMLQGKLREAREVNKGEDDESVRMTVEAELDFLQGKREADATLKELEKRFRDTYPMGIAEVYAQRGDRDAAFAWMKHARKVGDPDLIGIHNSAILKNLHQDPRWLPWLRELGLAPEQLDKIKFEVNLPETVAR